MKKGILPSYLFVIRNKMDADLEIIHSSIVDSMIKYTLLYYYYKIKKGILYFI